MKTKEQQIARFKRLIPNRNAANLAKLLITELSTMSEKESIEWLTNFLIAHRIYWMEER